MANVLQPIGTDASGYEVLTAAIRELLNQYPGLPQGERIKFEELEKDKEKPADKVMFLLLLF